MSRKLLAVALSSALLSTTILTGAAAAPANPAPSSAAQTASAAKNQPPLPPGRAIDRAQGEEPGDLGPILILGGIAAGTAIVLLMILNGDDDIAASTGT